MTRSALGLAVILMAVSCGQTSGSRAAAPPSASPSVSAAPSGAATPSVQPAGGPLTGPYGILLTAGMLDLVSTTASVVASVPIAASSVQFCSSNQDGAMEAPPVSASNDEVYFRDGDTKIRMVVPPASAADVTTVPGGPTTVSFFSVSPDDQRIAVLVEDVSGASTISLRLYVEDLHGGGHHANIYSTTTPKGKAGTTLWPMGWHNGALVLALMPACSFEPAGLTPLEWHVSSATTANRMATIKATSCNGNLSYFPSAAGVACMAPGGASTLYNWAGAVTSVTGPGATGTGYSATSLSPAGQSILFAVGEGIGAPSPATGIVQLGPGPYATVQGHSACLWIDEDHLLAPDAVIQFPASTPGNVQVNATVTPINTSGVCAGRLPGGL